MNRTVKFGGQLLFILVLFSILFTYAMFQGGFVSWFLFYAFLPIMLYHLGLLLYPMAGWEISRQLPKNRVSTGESITLTIRLKRSIPYPFYYLIVEEQIPDTLRLIDSPQLRYHHFDGVTESVRREPLKRIIYPWFKRTMQISFTVDNVPRGQHQLSYVRVRTGDVFGFIKKEHVFHKNDSITVYPATRRLMLVERHKMLAQGDAAAAGVSMEQTNVVTGVRAYVPGDKFSWIDWKQTARKNEIMTKEFEQEQRTQTMVILDGCLHENLNPAAFEASVEMGLSVIKTMRNQGMETGFLSLGTESYFSLIQQNREKIDLISNHLTHIQPGGTKTFASALEMYTNRLPGLTTIVITSHLDEAVRQTFMRMQKQGRRVVLIYIQAQHLIGDDEKAVLYYLRTNGIIVNELTEKELIHNMIEVGT